MIDEEGKLLIVAAIAFCGYFATYMWIELGKIEEQRRQFRAAREKLEKDAERRAKARELNPWR